MKNVILLTIDALRKDALGCYGNPNGLTPFFDSLADKCIKFTRCQSIGPYTQSSFPGIPKSTKSGLELLAPPVRYIPNASALLYAEFNIMNYSQQYLVYCNLHLYLVELDFLL